MRFCGEIQYEKEDFGGIHSDICFRCGQDDEKEMTDDYVKFLHDCLDEWLRNSNGTGYFWVGNPMELFVEIAKQEGK